MPRDDLPEPVTAFVALGANLADRAASLVTAREAIGRVPGVTTLSGARVYETDPVGVTDQPAFLNTVVRVHTRRSPRALLDELLDIERRLGRRRDAAQRWGPRTIDLDLVLFGDQRISEPGLVVPHPRLHERWFVLAPLADLAPSLVVPGQSRSIASLLSDLEAGARAGGRVVHCSAWDAGSPV